jgi:phosphatidylcholine synthase
MLVSLITVGAASLVTPRDPFPEPTTHLSRPSPTMHDHPPSGQLRPLLAALVHCYTAMGLVITFVAATCVVAGDLRGAYLALLVGVAIDASDGTLARVADVKRYAAWIDGRKLDDIVDYVNYTFLPILLIWRAGWLPDPAWLWCSFPLVTSALAFAHEGAKEEDLGFFRGFPSYWNIVAFYLDVLIHPAGPWVVTALVLGLSFLSLAPVRFVYPNRPPCWLAFYLGGATAWGGLLLIMLAFYPRIPGWLIGLSLVYPTLYVVTSFYLDWRK